MRRHSDHILGFVVVLLTVALMWYAAGFWVTVLLSLWLLLLRQILLYLLAKESRLAKTGALLMMPSAIFLFFLPRRIRNKLDELRSREEQKT